MRVRRRVAQLSLGLATILAGSGTGATGAIGASGLQVPATTWVGQIVAQSSLEPIPGVRISVAPVASPSGGNDVAVTSQESAGVVADAEGRFAIEARRGARLVLVADSYLDGFVELTSMHESDLGQLVLREELSFSGRLLQRGAPVAGAMIFASLNSSQARELRSPAATADETGRFHLGALRPEQLTGLVVVSGGIAQQITLGSFGRPVSARHHDLGDVELAPQQRMIGRIVGSGGAPLAGATVWLVSVDSPLVLPRSPRTSRHDDRIPYPSAVSDVAGTFELPLFAGTYTLVAYQSSYEPYRRRIDIGDGGVQAEAATIQMRRGVVAAGRVIDDAGRPLAGVRLRLIGYDTGSLSSSPLVAPIVVSTDANGCYRFEGLLRGEGIWLQLDFAGHVGTRVRRHVISGEGADDRSVCGQFGDIELPRESRITGVVVDQQQRPVPGVEVRRQRAQTAGRYRWAPAPGISRADGTFEIAGLLAGDYELHARKYGYGNETVSGLVVTTGQVTEARIELTELRDALPLQVQVLDSRGMPRPDAQVNASLSANGTSPQTPSPEPRITGADGRVLFPRAPMGVYSISASGSAMPHISWQGPFRLDNALPPVVLHTRPLTAPPAFVSGRLVGADGRGVTAALVNLQGGRGMDSAFEAITEAGGWFRFDEVPAGSYLLKATRRGMPEVLHRAEIVAAPPGVEGLVVEVPVASTIRGAIHGLHEGETLPRGVVASSAEAVEDRIWQGVESTAQVDADGGFRIDALIPGEWTVRAKTSSGRSVEAIVVIDQPGETVDVTLELPPGFTLTGTVTWRGRPRPEATVQLEGQRLDLDPGGRFEVRGLPPGRHRLQVGDVGLRSPLFEWFDIHSDRSIEIRIRGGAVSGLAVDAGTGEAIAAAHLRTDPRPQLIHDAHDQSHRTDSKGRFDVGPFPAGAWRFELTAPGYARRRLMIEIGDRDIDGLRIEMRRSPGLKLRFHTPDGSLPRSLTVLWQDLSTGDTHEAWFSLYGADTPDLQWSGVPLGRGILTVTNSKLHLGARFEVINTGEQVEVPLRPAGRLRITIPALADGSVTARLRLFDEDGSEVISSDGELGWETYEEGMIFVPVLLPGTYTAEIKAEDGRSWSQQIEVRAIPFNDIVMR